METKHIKWMALACAVLSSVVAMGDAGNVAHDSTTNGLVSSNANPVTNVNLSIRADIQSLSVGMAGDADVYDMRDAAATLFSRIESE